MMALPIRNVMAVVVTLASSEHTFRIASVNTRKSSGVSKRVYRSETLRHKTS